MRKSELRTAIICAKKAISEQSKVSKGCKTPDGKMKYVDALKLINKLETYFGFHGKLSIGCCGECEHATIRGHNGRFGEFMTCKKNSKTMHAFDDCEQFKEILEG